VRGGRLQRIRELDGLRGVAVLLVVVGHSIHHPSLVLWGPHWGWIGVNLFFVLSGFLITTILFRTVGGSAPLRTFYVRRVLRIFPLYYAVLLVYFAASLCAGTPQPWHTVGTYLFFLQGILQPSITQIRIVPHPAWVIMGFSVLWSLSAEEAFYLLWAPVVVGLRARRGPLLVLLASILLLDPVLRYFYPDAHWIQETFWGQMDSLAAGALLAALWMEPGGEMRSWAQRHRRMLLVVGVALIGCAIWLDLATGAFHKTPLHQRIFNAAEYSLLWAAWSMVLLAVLASTSRATLLARALRAPWLVWLGTISYCLYLVHYPVYLFWRQHVPPAVAVPVALACSLGISACSWRWLEWPAAAWKQKHYPMEKSIVPGAAP
jgi:peptidoglycan/LPS O-acetylase OafA/YrhL